MIGWLCYAHSLNIQRIQDPLGWALARLKEGVGEPDAAYTRLAQYPPDKFERLLCRHLEAGVSPPNPRMG